MKKYICENCGNEHNGSYGSGRFCSKHCRCSFNAKQVKTRKTCQIGKHKRAEYGTWKCDRCGLVFETRRQLQEHNHWVHPIQKGSSWNKGLTKDTDERVALYVKTCKERGHYVSPTKGKHIPDTLKAKISKSMKKYFKEHPDRVPYVLNHSSKESYPEQYFRIAFKNEGFPKFVQDKYVDGYFLDFAFDELKMFIEVDGEQHYVDKNIVKHDVIRKQVLDKTKWKCICRIRWSKFQKLTDNQKHSFIIGLKNKLK